MPSSRYAIGIDLGTSHCALSYIDTETSTPRSQVLPIPQLAERERQFESTTLPSFLYLPPPSETGERRLVGTYARNQTGYLPGRVIHSAKSWLCHGGVDREEKLLPWNSEEIAPPDRMSPVEVEAVYLDYLRRTWDHTVGADNEAAHFDAQDLTITVPASFDESAQRLTLKAASLAGIDQRLKLLEEPQAAFYYWLERHSKEGSLSRELLELLPELRRHPQTVLICDIGGGTTDFSLFEILPPEPRQRLPAIQRVAVSDHILLGGDNIDLATARRLEAKMGKIGVRQWNHLLSDARTLKEKILGGPGAPDEVFRVSLAQGGSSLVGGTVTAEIRRDELESLVLDGFFPWVEKGESPRRGQTGLREWGLPFASDSAVTRHLAGFLAGRDVQAVLFTGGSLKPDFLRNRLLEQLARWQARAPIPLVNDEMDLAVARGAAYYGAILQRPRSARAAKIRGGYPHTLYLELYRERAEETPQLVCLLPKGFEAGDKLKIRHLAFKLLLDQPVRFQLYYSNQRRGDEAGDLVKIDAAEFHPLPPLQTQLTLGPGAPRPADNQIEIAVEATVSETGLFQVFCVHEQERWQLDFNLRKNEAPSASKDSSETVDIGVPAPRLKAALDRLDLFYGKRRVADLKETPKNLKRELEQILGQSRDDWNIGLLRSLWPGLAPGITRRVRSPAHETSWLYLAGFCLRPGYGADLDSFRMSELWRGFAGGPAFPGQPLALAQWWILWRRVAGGLGPDEQAILMDRCLGPLERNVEALPEIILLAGSLERIPVERRLRLGLHLIRHLKNRKSVATEQYLWALGRAANRVPLYAGAEAALPTEIVEGWVREVLSLTLGSKSHRNLNLFLSQACRLTGDRNRDIAEPIRQEAFSRMEREGASDDQRRALQEILNEDLVVQARQFGEALPAGIRLAQPLP